MNTPRIHPSTAIAVLLSLLLGLAGCGNRGALYLPDETPDQTVAAEAAADDETAAPGTDGDPADDEDEVGGDDEGDG